MPLYTFGGSAAAVLTDVSGRVIPDYPLLVRVAGTGQTVTTMYEADGTTPIAQLRSNPVDSSAPGAVRTWRCEWPEIEYEYLDAQGQPLRWYEAGREVATDALAAAQQAQESVATRLPAVGGTAIGLRAEDGLALGPEDGDQAALFVRGGVVRAGARDGQAVALRLLDPESARIDLAGPVTTLFRKRPTAQPVAMQSLAVDSRAGLLYVCQLIQGGVQLPGEPAPVDYATRTARGDICVSQMSLTGTLTGRMYVRGAGHGVTLGVEYGRDGKTWLWLDRDSSSTGFARGLTRVQWQPDAVLESSATPNRAPRSGMSGVSGAVDPVNRRIAVHYTWPNPDPGTGGRRYELYDLDDAAQGIWVPLAQVDQAVNQTPGPGPNEVGVFQGFATFGSYLYSLDGAPGGPAYLTCLDWNSGRTVQRQLITAEPDLTYREPEGMCVWVPDPSAPHRVRLCFGWADGAANNRDTTVCYLQAAPLNAERLVGTQPQDGSSPLDVTARSGGDYLAKWRDAVGTVQTWISNAGRLATNLTAYFAGPGVQIGAVTAAFGGGSGGVVGLTDATTEPTSSPSGGGVVWAKGGALKYRGGSGGLEVDVTQDEGPAPADAGFLAWSMDPGLANSQTPPASGVVQLIAVRLRSPRTVSTVVLHAVNAGAGLTSGRNFVGIYNASTGQRVALSADQTSAWGSAGQKNVPLTAPVLLPAGMYYVAILATGTTTPAFTRASGQGGNMRAPGTGIRYGTFGSGLTALPTSITLGSVAEAAVAYTVALA